MQLMELKLCMCVVAGLEGDVAGLGSQVGPQPSYMQMAPPPVHPGAPVTDRGFTGPGGAAGGARRRLAGKLFERQHSLQDPSFDPVSQRLGMDEVIIVDLFACKCKCSHQQLLPFVQDPQQYNAS